MSYLSMSVDFLFPAHHTVYACKYQLCISIAQLYQSDRYDISKVSLLWNSKPMAKILLEDCVLEALKESC